MKNRVITSSLLLFSCILFSQNLRWKDKVSSIPIPVKWVKNLSGDFAFANNWSYPEGVYKNEFGQISCDGLCPAEIEVMKDSTGQIYEDSLQAFYEFIDTTHQMHSIQCEAWCYAGAGTDFIEVIRKSEDTVYCSTMTSIGTHCSLNIEIIGDTRFAVIDLESIVQGGDVNFYCTSGYISINKKYWKEGIMKAEFSFNFGHIENPQKPIFWKGKIYAKIKNA